MLPEPPEELAKDNKDDPRHTWNIAGLCCAILPFISLHFFDMMVNRDPFDDRAIYQEVWLDHYEDHAQ